MKPRSIVQAARDVGIGVETIRFYERRGLIDRPPRPDRGARHYSSESIVRLRFIREAQALGFTLSDIAELLALRVDPTADCAAIRVRAMSRRDTVRDKITQLERIAAALDAIVAACPNQGALGACSILEAIDHPEIGHIPRPAAQGRSQQTGEEGMRSMNFTIEGMHCGGCAQTLRTLLEREPGVKAAQVSHEAKNALVLFDPALIDEARLIATIERPGYRVTTGQ